MTLGIYTKVRVKSIAYYEKYKIYLLSKEEIKMADNNYEVTEELTLIDLDDDGEIESGLSPKTVLVIGAGLGIALWEGGKRVLKFAKNKLNKEDDDTKKISIIKRTKKKVVSEPEADEDYEYEEDEFYDEVEE